MKYDLNMDEVPDDRTDTLTELEEILILECFCWEAITRSLEHHNQDFPKKYINCQYVTTKINLDKQLVILTFDTNSKDEKLMKTRVENDIWKGWVDNYETMSVPMQGEGWVVFNAY